MGAYDPYRKPFPRGRILGLYRLSNVHRLRRSAYESGFKAKNLLGYHHDLGAQDVFLDNFGLVFSEQFEDQSQPMAYMQMIGFLLDRWSLLPRLVVNTLPWWGKHFNSKRRQANAGEPRGLLRLLDDEDLTRIKLSLYSAEQKQKVVLDESDTALYREDVIEEFWINPRKYLIDDDLQTVGTPDYWDPELMLDPETNWSPSQTSPGQRITPRGVPIPPDRQGPVRELRLLPPREATPDLPLRVGLERKDLSDYRKVIRDQGQTPTCVAHAISVGLDLLIRRQQKPHVQCSPAFVHAASGHDPEAGRVLSDAIEVIRYQLPCLEGFLPLNRVTERLSDLDADERDQIATNRTRLTKRYGAPIVRELRSHDISGIKTHLAAGWVVVITTTLTDAFLGRGFQQFGLPIAPIPGQNRLAEGHAWLLVGYDHLDGNNQWKYQGHFIALNSWGRLWPAVQTRGAGICALPFAMLLTEGLEAFALRLHDSRN